jgi:hypothetical protein
VQSQPKGVKPQLREHKFRSDGNWQQLLKQKCVKQMTVKQYLGAFLFLELRQASKMM